MTSDARGCQAVGELYRAHLTGRILRVTTRRGRTDAPRWIRDSAAIRAVPGEVSRAMWRGYTPVEGRSEA